MSVLTLSRDAQAIALLCSRLALPREGGPKPFGPAEWNRFAGMLRSTDFGRPGDLLGRDPHELVRELPISRDQADRVHDLLSRGGQLAIETERLASRGIWILTRADDEYPVRLKQRLRGDAPPLFYGSGPRSLLAAGGVAVVGSRDADDDALAFAHQTGWACAKAKAPVVSGAARGVDITAMLGALDAGGDAVGIAAEALERLVRRRELRGHVSEGSLVLVSPHHPNARFHAGNAMRRNRLIYCAADVAVVVASAASRGGTRAGAIEALDGRWIPVYVRDDGSPGNTELLRRGALPLVKPTNIKISHHSQPPTLLDAPGGSPESPSPPSTMEEKPVQHAADGSSAALAEEPATKAADPPVPIDARDLFAAVWPQLSTFLAEPRTEKQLSDYFALQRTQARAWLQRALEEGRVQRVGRSRRFVVADGQQTLSTD
jgi:DNA processing protein